MSVGRAVVSDLREADQPALESIVQRRHFIRQRPIGNFSVRFNCGRVGSSDYLGR